MKSEILNLLVGIIIGALICFFYLNNQMMGLQAQMMLERGSIDVMRQVCPSFVNQLVPENKQPLKGKPR